MDQVRRMDRRATMSNFPDYKAFWETRSFLQWTDLPSWQKTTFMEAVDAALGDTVLYEITASGIPDSFYDLIEDGWLVQVWPEGDNE